MKKAEDIQIKKVINGFVVRPTIKANEYPYSEEMMVFHTIAELNEWLECDHYAEDDDAEYWRNLQMKVQR